MEKERRQVKTSRNYYFEEIRKVNQSSVENPGQKALGRGQAFAIQDRN
jgi:hypothetical protein